ncbi:MAG: NAD(P)H-dependent oxidoreductase [Pseudomonadota bacterium]
MTTIKILCLSGSVRGGSFNTRLAALAKKRLALGSSTVTQVSLADYPMPIFNHDDEEASGVPESANQLYDLFCTHHGIFIANPEYNASLTPLLKNTIDWISRVKRPDRPSAAAYKNRVFALGAASPGGFGGYRGLLALRHTLEIGLGAHVLAEQISVSHAAKAFDGAGDFTDPALSEKLQAVLDRLIEMGEHYARLS